MADEIRTFSQVCAVCSPAPRKVAILLSALKLPHFSTEDLPKIPASKRFVFLPIIAFANAEKHNLFRHRAPAHSTSLRRFTYPFLNTGG